MAVQRAAAMKGSRAVRDQEYTEEMLRMGNTARQRRSGHHHHEPLIHIQQTSRHASYSPSLYSDEAPNRHDHYQPTRSQDGIFNQGENDSHGRHRRQTPHKITETSEIPTVDYERLSRMELARRGVCKDCRRYGKAHNIIKGPRSLICSSCGQNHDCANWEELNKDPAHKLLREPLAYPPSTFPSAAAAPPGPLRPPPLLKDRLYATVTPLGIPHQHQARMLVNSADDHSLDSATSPISPIAVTKALPILHGRATQGAETGGHDIFEDPKASDREVKEAAKDVKRVNYLRYKVKDRGMVHKGSPVPAIYAAQELSKATKGSSLIRTGEVKSGQVRIHQVYADPNCRLCQK